MKITIFIKSPILKMKGFYWNKKQNQIWNFLLISVTRTIQLSLIEQILLYTKNFTKLKLTKQISWHGPILRLCSWKARLLVQIVYTHSCTLGNIMVQPYLTYF